MTTIPIDPQDLDATRPVDIDACGLCGGTGGVPTGDFNVWRVEVEYDECPACGGTGSLTGAAA